MKIENIEESRHGSLIVKTETGVPGHSKIVRYFDLQRNPVSNGGWGHENRFRTPEATDIVEVELLDEFGKRQSCDKNGGFCLPFLCPGHFDRKKALPIRLTADPLILYVGNVARIGLYGDLQRVYDANGNELVLNRTDDGYILFLVDQNQNVLQKFYLKNAFSLCVGPEGFSRAVYQYNEKGERTEEKYFDAGGGVIKIEKKEALQGNQL